MRPHGAKWSRGPGFSSPNQPDQERTTAYRDSSGPKSRSDAHYATTVGDWEEPSGESRLMTARDKQHEIWVDEYTTNHGVPTTKRGRPTTSDLRLLDTLRASPADIGTSTLDLGCGAGRNAVYLAQRGWRVVGVDFVPAALRRMAQAAHETGVAHAVLPVCASLGQPLPFRDAAFDLALDVTTSASLALQALRMFERELHRVLKPNGMLLSYVMADDDPYLAPRCDQDGYATVPESGLIDRCFSVPMLKDLYSRWEILHLDKVERQDTFFGREYARRLWWLLARRSATASGR